MNYKNRTMKKIWMLALGVVLGSACSDDKGPEINFQGVSIAPSFTDERDGQEYKCIQVGDQVWMAENLRYRIPLGALEGCYTWGEESMTVDNINIDIAKYTELVNEAITDGRIVDPPGLMPWLCPTVLIPMYLDMGMQPPQIIQYMAQYPEIAALLQEFYDNLYEEAVEIVTKAHFMDAEAKNGGYTDEFGYLYDYQGALAAIPEGWRLPTDEDWKKLEKHLGMSENEVEAYDVWRGQGIGQVLRAGEGGIGFDWLLGGCNAYTPEKDMNYIRRNQNGYLWTSTLMAESDTTSLGVIRGIALFDKGVMRTTTRLQGHFPVMYNVRCIKKEEE